MKRAITALALVGALLLSVVACQVYNPTNNETLYTAMRTEGAVSKADYLANFEKAATAEVKAEYFKEYEAESVLAYQKQLGEKVIFKHDALLKFSEDVADDSFVKTYATDWLNAYKKLEAKYAEVKAELDAAGISATDNQKNAVASAEDSLKRYGVTLLEKLWNKKYAVNWDWNSELGKVN